MSILSRDHAHVTTERPAGSDAGHVTPFLESRPDSLADRLGDRWRDRSPITATSVVAVTGLIVMALVMVGLGLLLVHVLLNGGLGRWDTSVNEWFVTQRTTTLNAVTRWGSDLGATTDDRRDRARRLRGARDRPPVGRRAIPPHLPRDRGLGLPDLDRLRQPREARRPPARRLAADLELPVRAHGRRDRALRGPRAHRELAHPATHSCARWSGSSPSRCRSWSRCRGCTGACTTRPT